MVHTESLIIHYEDSRPERQIKLSYAQKDHPGIQAGAVIAYAFAAGGFTARSKVCSRRSFTHEARAVVC